MSHLPFSSVSNCDLTDLLKYSASLHYLSEHLKFDLRNFLVKSNKYVTQSLDCSYYTCEEFKADFIDVNIHFNSVFFTLIYVV